MRYINTKRTSLHILSRHIYCLTTSRSDKNRLKNSRFANRYDKGNKKTNRKLARKILKQTLEDKKFPSEKF